ncbi:MAG: hypothetical protein HYV63_26585 [Candidatus Schekmanbacteria bacterium]|nr:hypothetical protein [Candidatus Schekmanbacteria bacterium]
MTATIDRCASADIAEVAAFFRIAFPFNPRLQEQDYLDWQFRDTPFRDSDDYNIFVLHRDGAIRGVMAYVPVMLRLGQREVVACWTANWHAPGQGVHGLRLLAEVNRVSDFRLHVGLTERSLTIYRRMSMPCLESMDRWLLPLNLEAVLDIAGVAGGADAARLAESSQHAQPGDGGAVEHLDELPADRQIAFDHWPDLDCGVSRRTDFVNWRYVQIPRHHYKILRGDEEQFAVIRFETIAGRNFGICRLLEWTCHGAIGRAVLGEIIRLCRLERAILLDFYSTARSLAQELRALGFLSESELAKPIPRLFRPLGPGWPLRLAVDLPPHRHARSLDFGRWYVTLGDSDLDRVKL